jgi:hypothetical protein
MDAITKNNSVKRVIAGGLFALFAALLIGALTVFGVINMTLGHVLMILAAIVGSLLVWTEIIPSKPPSHKIAATLLMWIAVGAADFGITKLKASEGLSGPTATPVSPLPVTPSIDQNATDSTCSNLVAGSDAQITCTAEEKKKHAKVKP